MQLTPSGVPNAGLPQRRRPTPHRLTAEYDDRPAVVEDIGHAVRSLAIDWGIPHLALVAERLTSTQVSWLMDHFHPDGARILLDVEYDGATRMLQVVVGDNGGYVPFGYEYDSWYHSLHPACEVRAAQCSGTNRRLYFVLKVPDDGGAAQ
jgi:hypothetical protein